MNAVLMNTGKSVIRNAKVSLDVEGVTTGGVLFIGEVPVGESKSGTINFMVDSDAEGEIKGTATITDDCPCAAMQNTQKNIYAVQFHPEACGGPLDTAFLFDRFINMIKENKNK